MKYFVLIFVVFLCTGCVGSSGIVEFQVYRTAFSKTNDTANSILDQLAIKERKLFLRHNSSTGSKFNPDLAAYYTDSVDPPATGAYRKALASVNTYNELLYGLASGQTAEAISANLATLAVQTSQAAASIVGSVVPGGQGLGQLNVFSASVKHAVAATEPFLKVAVGALTREDFRIFSIKYHPIVKKLLKSMRSGTEVMFPVLTADIRRRVRNSPVIGAASTQAEIEKIRTLRKLLADWVILIDDTIIALDHANRAILAGPTPGSAAAGLAAIAVDLEVASRSAKENIAKLAAN